MFDLASLTARTDRQTGNNGFIFVFTVCQMIKLGLGMGVF